MKKYLFLTIVQYYKNINYYLDLQNYKNMVKYSNLCLLYKIIDGFSSPPLHQFVQTQTAEHSRPRGAARGDCIITFRKSVFGQTAFSAQATTEWNLTPITIRNTYSLFKAGVPKLFPTKGQKSNLIVGRGPKVHFASNAVM